MVEWPQNRTQGDQRPVFDRTVIRPAGQGPKLPEDPPKDPEPAVPRHVEAEPKRGSKIAYVALALVFLGLGGGIGGLAHLINSGAISFSAPEVAPEIASEAGGGGQPQRSTVPIPSSPDTGPANEETVTAGSQEAEEPPQMAPTETVSKNEEDLDLPADPFFDMALSAVIPLAGDPVLLKGGGEGQRIELSERPIPVSSATGGESAVPALTAFVLDSRMLNDSGDLVIRAPGSEADFQFGNFGGGQDSEGLVVEEDQSAASDKPNLPVFLKPPSNTLDLFLTERPIGQGASRIEIKTGIKEAVTLETFLKEHSFDEETSKSLLEFSAQEFQKTGLAVGDKVAVRGVRLPNKVGRIGDYYRPVQISFYSSDGYIGTAAYSVDRDGGRYVHGADPWFGKTIVEEEQKVADAGSAVDAKSHRLIDGLYATAVRNAVPASIVGEAIAYLAPMTDLKRTIKPDERFTLVFTGVPRDEKRGGGRVLYAGVRQGDKWSVRCYVLKAPGNRGFACVNEGGKVSLSGAMLVPVKGVLTSKFGMRYHPIKKIERLHAGVDWAAPTGTPIRAAFSGKVTYRDVRGGYGNFIELTHKDGISSRYAHMHEYADGIQLGSVVQAGDLIGYVGTTGLSTGPHLHFEIRQRGEPTDPLAFEMEAGTDAPQSVASADLKQYRSLIGEILVAQ
ncbi:M23 family metallopeptidase [Roseibium aggregatum]|uniref:M23 family metallopeptidase n=1 Tax=Roseibium aggregatum TaxID=187304 RepID=A0A939EBM5_9HYPH|nr:M23 family metallopeptidase [Roseibium aggregatum]MBN9670366.1 M23 family metallopeptidase [Roseibium aggregatum]